VSAPGTQNSCWLSFQLLTTHTHDVLSPSCLLLCVFFVRQVLLLLASDVLEHCVASVRQLKGITATYRMTAKGPPVRHSHYVAGASVCAWAACVCCEPCTGQQAGPHANSRNVHAAGCFQGHLANSAAVHACLGRQEAFSSSVGWTREQLDREH
jgi:hypothetical protein